jgi:dipeptidase D
LGADNGIAVAYCLAIAANKKAPHPKLEILLSANEEVAPQHIDQFNTSLIKSKYMINLDSEEIDICYVGCVSCGSFDVVLPIKQTKCEAEFDTFTISIKGLKGGHSGAEISKARGNAIKAVIQLLNEASAKNIQYQLISVTGAKFSNVIPSNSDFTIATSLANLNKIKVLAKNVAKTLNSVYVGDNTFNFSFGKNKKVTNAVSIEDSRKMINLLNVLPHGVFLYNKEMDMFESATNL